MDKFPDEYVEQTMQRLEDWVCGRTTPAEQLKEMCLLLLKLQTVMKEYLHNTENFDHYYMDLAREHIRKVNQLITKEAIKNGVKEWVLEQKLQLSV